MRCSAQLRGEKIAGTADDQKTPGLRLATMHCVKDLELDHQLTSTTRNTTDFPDDVPLLYPLALAL